ncbi:recombinase family protein [Nocardioides bruguierae]|uniref:recombinase family protein n=1 Tax=Nocardioides bruguierae TaxID=2945102 RepID=UPI00202182A5|nr:recombinase family protein [Nocardioides bruguierae]MCL8025657.1 recombinase family protein [Nocardioides bruguierae]
MNDSPAKRALIYTRVSRDDSGEGQSNQRQEESCRTFANLRGYEVVDVEADISTSAYSGKVRPAWSRVLERVRAEEVDIVLAWKVDRVTRTVRELVSIIDLFREHNVSVVTVDGDLDLSTPQGRAVATILGSVAQMEVERKGERQRAANAQRRAEGQPWKSGWASFGYDLDKNLIPEQAEMIRKAAADVLSGQSLKGIAREWRASGVTTPRSSQGADGWTHNGVKTILLNPVNAGINTYQGKEIGPGAWEPILPESTLRQLQALLGDPARRTGKAAGSGRRAENLLSGIAKCATCGHKVQAGSSNGKKVYKCSNPSGDHLTTEREAADTFVLNALTSSAGEIFDSSRVLPDVGETEAADHLVAEIEALDRRERLITERFTDGSISEETWSLALAAAGKQREDLQARLATSGGDTRTAAALAKARIDNFLALSLSDKRLALQAIVDIELHSRQRRRNRPISEQVSVWSRNPDRLSPLVAGNNPASLSVKQEILAERDAKVLAMLGDDYADDDA